MRMPVCEYISQTKHPDTNNGNSEWHCSKFGWTDSRFKSEREAGVSEGIYTQWFNHKLFEQCKTCPFNVETPAIVEEITEEELPEEEPEDEEPQGDI